MQSDPLRYVFTLKSILSDIISIQNVPILC